MLHPCICFHRGQHCFPLLLEIKTTFRVVLQTYFSFDHRIDFYVVSLYGLVRNQEKVSQAYEMSVSKKLLHTKWTTLHFVVGNEQCFPLLLVTHNVFWNCFSNIFQFQPYDQFLWSQSLHGIVGNQDKVS